MTAIKDAIINSLSTFEPYRGKPVGPDSSISSRLDSLALVGFLVDMERYLEEHHGLTVNLTEELMSRQDNPLTTVKQFTRYLEERLQTV